MKMKEVMTNTRKGRGKQNKTWRVEVEIEHMTEKNADKLKSAQEQNGERVYACVCGCVFWSICSGDKR